MASVRKWFGNIAPRLPLKPPQRTIRLAILWIHLPPLCVTLTWLPWFLHLPSHLTSRSNHLISLLPRTISRCWRGTMRSRSRGPRPRINRGWSRGINWHLLRACPSQCRKFYCVIFTDNQEIEVARWLHNNPLFYNHKLKLHKDDKKKKTPSTWRVNKGIESECAPGLTKELYVLHPLDSLENCGGILYRCDSVPAGEENSGVVLRLSSKLSFRSRASVLYYFVAGH